MKRINDVGFLVLFGGIFGLILYKIIKVPITHDETATTVHYIKYNVWEIMMYPDDWPNNHILNTLSVKLLVAVFGAKQWVVRLPNLLAFVVYGIAVFRMLRILLSRDSFLVLPAALFFVCNPFLLDFFGVSRGYGIACAFCALSVSYVVEGIAGTNEKKLAIGVFFSILSSYANFSALVFWVAINAMVMLYVVIVYWTEWKKLFLRLVVLGTTALAYFALIRIPIHKMRSTDQFKYWTSKGFYHDTLISLINNSRYGSKKTLRLFTDHGVAAIAIIIAAVCIVYLIRQVLKFKSHSWSTPLFVTLGILIASITVSICQSILLGTPNLNGRTALFYYVLYILVLAAALGVLDRSRHLRVRLVIGILGLIVGGVHLFSVYNSHIVWEWQYDQNNLEVLEYLSNKRKQNGTVELKVSWKSHPSFYFYQKTGVSPWLSLGSYNKEIEPDATEKYYYVFESEVKLLEKNYIKERKFGSDRWLLKRISDQ